MINVKKIKRLLGLVRKLSNEEFKTKFKSILNNLDREKVVSGRDQDSINAFYFLREVMSKMESDDEIMLYVENIIMSESQDLKNILIEVIVEYVESQEGKMRISLWESAAEQLESDLRSYALYLAKFRAGLDEQ